MKKLILLALVLFSAATMLAQTNRMSYQAVVRNAANELVAEENLTVSIRISDANGTSAFSETHSVTSNRNGVISLMIGEGSGQSGNMASVDWRTAQIHTEVTLPIGTTLSNTTPVNAVPYAFYADSVDIHWVNDAVDDYLEHHSIGSIVETDPTVPAWAKEATKPVYDYSEITNTPTIPTNVGELTNDANYITLEQVPAQVNADWNATEGAAQILNKPELFSGDYNDLTNTPTIPTVPANVSEFNNDAEYVTTNQLNAANYITAADVPAQVNADWNATEGAAQILNKPELFSGDYNDLTNTPTIPTVPTNVGEFNNDAEYVTTTQLNAANYITAADVPAQVNADWNATEGAAQILNKPELFSGDYNDLTNTPTIPTVPANVSEFTNDANYITNSKNSCASSVDLCELLEKLELLENQLEPIMILTQGVTAVTQTSFTVNGKVQSDGSSTVTQRGFVYASSNPNPTLSDSHVNSGSGNGTFTSTITGLTAGITYYVRAYATNQNGTFYGSEVAVTTTATSPSTLPNVTTIAITNISINEATVKGAVTSDGGENVTQRGFVYDTLPNPTTSSTVAYHGTGVGQFSNLLSGLFSGKTYYVRAFATNSVGTAYGNEISFTTNVPSPVAGDAIPCPNTPTVTDHEGNVYNTVKIGTQCWTKENLRTTTSPSTGTYLIPPAGTEITHSGKQARWYNNDSATYAPKNCGLLYNWNAAMDTFNTMYGETSVNPNFYEGINVDVEFIGHRRGICPQGWHVPSSDEWTQLTDYLKSHEEYWKNGIADYIASSLASTTDWYKHDWEDCIYCPRGNPTDNNLSGFTAVPAGVIGGDQNEKDFSRITAFWSSNQTYWYGECALNLIVGGWDAAVIVTGPTKNSLLSVRCLRNETGGGSGTTATLPTVTTGSVSDVTATSAMCGGEVTADGGAEVTARGVCWGTLETPTVADAHTSDGTGIGIFTSSITGLTEGTTYYVRAYATNSEGTAYGDQLTFMTSSSTTPTPVDGDAIPCPGTPTVTDHEGNVYNTVQIGTQCWTKENLRTTTSPSTGTYLIPAADADYTYTGKQARWYNNDSVTHASQIFNQSIVFSEDFSAVTDSASYTISNSLDNYTQIPGWIGNWVYPSNGKVKVGKSSSAGFIQTPALDLSANNGQFVVTFDAKAWNNDTTSLILEVDGVPYTVSGLSTTDFKTFSIPFYGGTESSVIKFQGCQVIKGGRFFLDNVYISTQLSVNYGLLYNWNAAVDTFNTAYGETSVNTSSSNAVSVTFSGHRRGICPAGWHLPNDAEWTQLTDYVGSQSEYTCSGNSSNIAKALASTEGWNTYTDNCAVGNDPSSNNATGFSAVPAGHCGGSSFYNAGITAHFWSSTQDASDPNYAYSRYLNSISANVYRDGYNKYCRYSVRCLRD